MKAEYEHLLDDVLRAEELRAESLEGCLSAVRSERVQRRIRLTAALTVPAVLALIASLVVQLNSNTTQKPMTQIVKPEVIPGTTIELIGDEQLFELFKDRPTALVGPPGNQRFLLLDEAVTN